MKTFLRELRQSDEDFLFQLRNKPYVFNRSLNGRKITKKEHKKFIDEILFEQRKDKELFIIESNGAAGQIRFDYNGVEAVVNISILKKFQGKGLGLSAFQLAKRKLKNKGFKKIIAIISPGNKQSISFFERLNFKFFQKIKKNNKVWLNYKLEL
jgi:RimJ/RimL family protein N-acetyltransferase